MVSIAALQAERLTSAMCCPRSARRPPHWDLKQTKCFVITFCFLPYKSQIPPEKPTHKSQILDIKERWEPQSCPTSSFFRLSFVPCSWLIWLGSCQHPRAWTLRFEHIQPPAAFVQIHSSSVFPSSGWGWILVPVNGGCSKTEKQSTDVSQARSAEGILPQTGD